MATLKETPAFLATFPGTSLIGARDTACSAAWAEEAHSIRTFSHSVSPASLFDFYGTVWEEAGWRFAGRDQTNLYYEKDYGDWRATLRLYADSTTYLVDAYIVQPLCA
ncbi:MAG: hypothetical protein WEB06_21395 [Actinomycetota bacterium]